MNYSKTKDGDKIYLFDISANDHKRIKVYKAKVFKNFDNYYDYLEKQEEMYANRHNEVIDLWESAKKKKLYVCYDFQPLFSKGIQLKNTDVYYMKKESAYESIDKLAPVVLKYIFQAMR